jgi:hypothetical protein
MIACDKALTSIKPAKSTAILPEERLASEVQALLDEAAGGRMRDTRSRTMRRQQVQMPLP